MKEIKIFTIDFRSASTYVDGEHEAYLTRGLKAQLVLGDRFLYTIVDGCQKGINNLKEKGTYRKDHTIFAFTQEQLRWEDDNTSPNCIKHFEKGYDYPALVIWDRDHFIAPKIPQSDFHYQFKQPQKKQDALEAIARLRLI